LHGFASVDLCCSRSRSHVESPRFFVHLGYTASFSTQPVHQSPEDSLRQARQQIVCYQTNPDNRAWKKKLWDGYELSLGPTPHAADNPEEACTAAIYNAAGKVVYRSTGFNTRYHDATGMVIDGDGAPDVVLMTDTGGGNHCCWEIEVLSLQPKPHLVFTYNPAGAFSFRKDRDGRATLWSVEGGLIEIGYSMADRPFALMVRKVIDGKLTNVTPESCPLCSRTSVSLRTEAG
jgi:hypothetical protein